MDWLLQDWEYTNDEIYAVERQKEIEAAWHKCENEQENKKRKPAIIKIVKHEINNKPSTIRRAHQNRTQP
ncbi:MAG: hypothetical protein JHC33_11730 [Ignisphaera sp.]|nr:hypothetical protein [Ignisphaera sp.]